MIKIRFRTLVPYLALALLHSTSLAQSDYPFFGGSDSKRWTYEAALANVVTTQIRAGFAKDDVADVIVSIPVLLHDSTYFQYGDGQSNATISFGPTWANIMPSKQPPLVVRTERLKDGSLRESIVFHPSLKITSYEKKKFNSRITYIRPQGWNDWFVYSNFANTMAMIEFGSGLPASFQFKDGRTFPDPERIIQERQKRLQTVNVGSDGNTLPAREISIAETLMNHRFGPGYNPKPYEVPHTHGVYPNEQGMRTATGSGRTWVVEAGAQSPVKHLYTCFEGRDLAKETLHGVPSGSGWHKIGDPAETIIHSLESRPILVGVAIPAPRLPPSNGFAYGLTHTASFKMLKPREVFLTERGNYHWYANPEFAPVCTEILVHPCLPSPTNNWGFTCDN